MFFLHSYKRDDGSFSAFGQRDEHGSTFLTAFVLKCFSYSPTYVYSDFAGSAGRSVILESIKFLKNQQTAEGYFVENGKMLSSAVQVYRLIILITSNYSGKLQGGVNSLTAMTAYVVIAILGDNFEHLHYIERVLNYLEKNVKNNSTYYSTYDLAIITYALTLGNRSIAVDLLTRLEDLSITSGIMQQVE